MNPECIALGKHRAFVGPAIGVTIADTPQGPITSFKALWPAGVRQKASKDASLLAERISKLEISVAEKRRAQKVAKLEKGVDAPAEDDVFRIVTSGRTMDDLITYNVDGGKPN